MPMIDKKTLVLGASLKPERYSYHAVEMLTRHEYPVEAVGLRAGEICGIPIQLPFPRLEGIHTVSMYVGPRHQPYYYDFILSLNPSRVIFNPGTENPEFEKMLAGKGIETVRACTLVMIVNQEF